MTACQVGIYILMREQSDPEKAASKRRVFSLIYGYFAIMGGLAVDVSDIDDRLHSVTLTPAGLKHLAERGHFIEVSDGDIRDKSKADIFAKCLVILQVTWIALQTISRKAAGYPLSTLEIHTLVHAACASVMYILWFRKPLDVQAPTIVSKAGFEDSIAMMLMQTPGVGTSWYSHLDPPKDFEPAIAGPRSETSFLMFDNTALSRRSDGCPSCGGYSTPSTKTNTEVADKGVFPAIPKTCDACVNLSNLGPQQARNLGARTLSLQTTARPPSGIRCGPPPGVRAVCELRSGDFTRDGIGLQPLITFSSYHDRYIPLPWWCCFLRFLHPCPPEPTWPVQISPTLKERLPPTTLLQWPAYWHEIKLSLSEKDLRRWKLAYAYLISRGVKAKSKHYPNLDQHYKNFPLSWFVSKPITRRSRNVNFLYPQSDSDWSKLVWTLWFLCSLYGGIHLALWNYEFPTRVESRLWRISAVALGSAPILLLLLGWSQSRSYDYVKRFIRKFRFIKRAWENNLDGIRYGLILMGGAAALFYTFARIYIVVESFISLRHVPIGVYEGGLGWSKYIPHL